jgi:hypothetical protein
MPLLPTAPCWSVDHRPRFLTQVLDWLPPFVTSGSSQARYCHRPRSATRHTGQDRISVHAWCGQLLVHAAGFHYLPPVDMPVCGTCEGRAVGAGWPTSEEIITARPVEPWPAQRFTPRPCFDPPRWCPVGEGQVGRRNGEAWLVDPDDERRGVCLMCHAEVQLRWRGDTLNGWWGPQRHEPLEMIPPCRLHGWLRPERVNDPPRIVCKCKTNRPDDWGYQPQGDTR